MPNFQSLFETNREALQLEWLAGGSAAQKRQENEQILWLQRYLLGAETGHAFFILESRITLGERYRERRPNVNILDSRIENSDSKVLSCSTFQGLEARVERVMGIEPTLAAWEAAVLPLNYTRAGRRFYGRDAPIGKRPAPELPGPPLHLSGRQ